MAAVLFSSTPSLEVLLMVHLGAHRCLPSLSRYLAYSKVSHGGKLGVFDGGALGCLGAAEAFAEAFGPPEAMPSSGASFPAP
eukprot:CAMPEP_0197629518 /NCGR_PEP_ID=MMETSP1338-20131121/7333_1 /TAXON_ID=43686 ORGANISM="Pelagodinium beii, Strain RCC1491" /NCGR_SAMPLE_ID=MMETSP1338 /ASSEMBLY_ACC=CAM_ASM_000754 /LENGTH=81 /DNA_ID=CAMNT_0043200567 /DNA_START=579 /DNA_END=820 /DNA_ORIENTATION=-